jgi:hypothetical protein
MEMDADGQKAYSREQNQNQNSLGKCQRTRAHKQNTCTGNRGTLARFVVYYRREIVGTVVESLEPVGLFCQNRGSKAIVRCGGFIFRSHEPSLKIQ